MIRALAPDRDLHVDQLDVVSPQWLLLDGSLGRLAVTSDLQAEAIIASAKTPPSVLPMVHNGHNGISDGPLANNLILNPAAEKALRARGIRCFPIVAGPVSLEDAMRDDGYLKATREVLRKHGALWFNDESFVISRKQELI